MTIEIYIDAHGKWRWRAVAFNQRIIADSGQGYASRRGVERAWRHFAELTGTQPRVVWMAS